MTMPTVPLHTLTPQHRLRHLELAVTRRLDGLLNGEHHGLMPGPGSELGDARAYVPGDDVRHMDWAVTARTTHPHVRELIADHELEAWAVVDLSPSMDFGSGPDTLDKRDLAIAAMAAVGFLTARLGDRFGAVVAGGEGLRPYPPRAGRAAFIGLLHDLHRAERAPRRPKQRPGLADAITRLNGAHTRRGLAVVISDFLDPADDTSDDPADDPPRAWERPLRRLGIRHQLLAIEIVDPLELELPDIGTVTMADPETGAAHDIHLSGRLRSSYARAAQRQRTDIRDRLRRCGAAHLRLSTDRDWIADLARFALRQRRTAGRRRP